MGILVPGDTSWCIETADRVAFLIDTQAYFSAVRSALRQAKRSVTLLGWGFDPRTRLAPDGQEGHDEPDEIGQVLIDISRARPDLDIRVLIWKSALPISASQAFFPHSAHRLFKNTPIRFLLDASVPYGACHHQKVLVIDDAVAFCGGGDLCVDRWDSTRHLDVEPRRVMPDHDYHPARHDVFVVVDGAAAKALGELARERWFRATGERMPKLGPAELDPWPKGLAPHLSSTRVGIGRTEPAWHGRPLVQEIRHLSLESIYSAKKLIYLENQYFASPVAVEAIAERLAEPDGPEVILVSTGSSPSWFDRLSMDRARSNMLERLRAADLFDRFRALYPTTEDGSPIIVHSKVTVIDDDLVRIGSANLNNRSGGFDTECELAFESNSTADQLAFGAFRDRAIGHFLGVSGDRVTKARGQLGAMIPALESQNAKNRLRRIEPMKLTPFGQFIAATHLGDPVEVADSWHPGRRQKRLYQQTRALGEGGMFRPRNWTLPLMPRQKS